MDKDGDGKIPAVELEAFFRGLGSTPPTEEEAAMMVSLVDTDGDGYITMEELCALGAATTGTAEPVEAFRVFDVNGDGRISAEELHSMLAALGHHGYTLDDCRKMIRSIDSDGDRFVGFEEFERMMSKRFSVNA